MEINKQDVLTALECCAEHNQNLSCDDCYYKWFEQPECTSRLAYDALVLLNEKLEDGKKIRHIKQERTPIEGLEWILEDDRFGFGENWTDDSVPESEEEQAGYYIQRAIDALMRYEAINRRLFEEKSNDCGGTNEIN